MNKGILGHSLTQASPYDFVLRVGRAECTASSVAVWLHLRR